MVQLSHVWQHVANKLGVYTAAKVAIVCTAQDGALCSVGLQHCYEPLYPDHKDRVGRCHTPLATKGKAQELGFHQGLIILDAKLPLVVTFPRALGGTACSLCKSLPISLPLDSEDAMLWSVFCAF